MKKLIKLEFDNTTRERKTEDSYSELYSHDKNNGSFEFEILNDTLTTEQVIALFKFTESNKIWKTTGTVEGNKVNVTFDTTLITQNETVICYLYFDEEQRTSDTFRFKFKVKVSEIDKMNRYEVKERFINNTVIVDRLDVVTKTELQEALKNVGGIATEGLLTEVKAEELYAKKSEAVDNTNFELVKNRVLALELKTDKDTVYDDREVKERLTTLENKPPVDLSGYATKEELRNVSGSQPTVDTSNLVTRDELESKGYVTDLSEYAKKSELYNDSDLKARVEVLEQKTDKDTVYDDTPLKERVTALESKAIEGGAYDDKPIRDRLDVLEAKHYVTVEALNNKAYLTSHQDLSNYALKSEIPTPYNDSPLTERVTALESKAIEGGAYDDSDLRNRVVALESKEDKDTKYDDTDLRNRVTNLENKPPLDTSEFVTNQSLESKGYIKDVSNLVTKDELENKHYLTTHQSLDHVVTKDELQAKNYISDISNLVTKDELASKNYLTEHQPLTEVNNRLDVLEARPIVTPYNDTALSDRVTALETKQDKDTVYNDEPIKERLTTLETKVDKDTVYNDSELRERVTNLENKPNVDLTNYVTSEQLESKHYLTQHQPLDNLVTKEELNSKGYVTEETLNSKGYLTQHQSLEEYAKKSELYNDTEVKQRLTTLESKPNIDTSNFVTNEQLESKHYLTQHQELTHLATTSDLEVLRNISVNKAELSTKVNTTEFNTFKENVVTKTELAEKGYISDLSNYVTKQELQEATEIDYSNIVTTDELEPYAKKSELPTPYNDTALVSRVSALESKQDKDTVYNDTEVKQRLTALENRPSVSGGTQTQDTGWITISDNEPLNGNVVKIRRINDMVHVSLSNQAHEDGSLALELDSNEFCVVLANKEISKGFTPLKNITLQITRPESDMKTLENGINLIGQAVYKFENNKVRLNAYGNEFVSGMPMLALINDFSYYTEDPYPTNLN